MENQVQWNRRNTLQQFAGDETLLCQVMEIFLREAPQHLAALHLAVKQGNAEQVESTAHTLKGELGYLGVPEISRKARELEQMGKSRNLEGAADLFPLFAAELSSLFRAVRNSSAALTEAHLGSGKPGPVV